MGTSMSPGGSVSPHATAAGKLAASPGEIKRMGQQMAGGDLFVEMIKISAHKF